MKKLLIALLLVSCVLVSFAGCDIEDVLPDSRGGGKVNSSVDNGASNQAADSYISEADAKEKAFGHAGISESDAIGFRIELDRDDRIVHYDIEFRSGNYEYDYEINAETGEIISSEKDFD